ncbi:ABC transporter substrate-binding protein [Neobacillus sp. Marseille-QA0830]
MAFLILTVLVLLAGCSSDTTSTSTKKESNKEQTGGTLKIAINAQPPTLDTHLTTTTVALEVTRNIFETLVTQNANQQPVPMLAESIDKSDDGLTYTFHLRKGVPFHNGKEMKAEDVLASMNRWLQQSSRAKLLLSGATFEAKDDYTVELKLQTFVADVLDIMAGRGQFPAIMPKEVIESAGKDGITEYIGTGPFQFVEWKQDQYIRLKRFDDYASVDEESSGTAGKKKAYVDEVYYYIVNDPSTRMAGVQTGEYDIATAMPYDSYEDLKSNKDLKTYVSFDQGTLNLTYNKKHGLFSNQKMRDAVNTALDLDAIMLASYGNKDLYKLSPGYMSMDQVDWATDAGKKSYNLADPKSAKNKLKEAGYNGEEIVIYSTRDYEYMYNSAVVIKEELEQIGMKVKLEIFDWPTLIERRENPENWDLMVVGTGYVTTPSQLLVVNPNYVGWTNDQKMTEMLASIRTAGTQEEAKNGWEELQSYMWDNYLPFTLFGHYSTILTTSKNLKDLTVFQGAIPWNVKKVE